MSDATHNLSLEEMDRQSVLHPFTALKPYAAGELGDPASSRAARASASATARATS